MKKMTKTALHETSAFKSTQVERKILAWRNSGLGISDRFVEVNKTVEKPSEALMLAITTLKMINMFNQIKQKL
jgi:hypothetical protein